MAVIQTGNQLGMAILKALGIDHKNVASVHLSAEPNECACVTITRHIDADEATKLATALEEYDLVRRGDRVALPVVGMDMASGPDWTTWHTITPEDREALWTVAAPAGLFKVQDAFREAMEDRSSPVMQAMAASFTHRNKKPRASEEPKTVDPMEAVRAMSKGQR